MALPRFTLLLLSVLPFLSISLASTIAYAGIRFHGPRNVSVVLARDFPSLFSSPSSSIPSPSSSPSSSPSPTSPSSSSSSSPSSSSSSSSLPQPLSAPLAAWGYFNDTIGDNGWSFLSIHSNISFSDEEQAYAAGYLEGFLTAQRTWEYISNAEGLETGFSPSLKRFVEENNKWVAAQADAHGASDVLWHQVKLLYMQNEGMYDGYSRAAQPAQRMGQDVFYAATLAGEKDDLCVVYGCKNQASGAYERARRGDGHCSVLVKVVNGSELYTSHTTWSTLETMTRVYKKYDLPYSLSGNGSAVVPGRVMTFSSYPAMMFSMDDFYQISSGLVVTETTIVNNNHTLWRELTSQALFDWVRNMLANRLAASGAEWAQWFAKYNSGTYNNEFMIVDYNKFVPHAPLQPGLLTVLEQMPGENNVVWEDLTTWLDAPGYWASYNRPFFPAIQRLSEQQKMIDKYGDHFSWYNTSRAVLFRAHQAQVVDEASYRALMRWNHFETDAIATQGCKHGRSASNAISERGDLTQRAAGCFDDIGPQDEVGTDCKYTTYALMKEGRYAAWAQSGPTYDTQPPFVWSQSPYKHVAHVGQPDKWAFPWVLVDWSGDEDGK